MPARANEPLPKSPGSSVIALDLGGTKLAGAVFSGRGQMLFGTTISLNNRQGRRVGELITGQIQKLFTIAAQHKIKVRAIGISVPGISHRQKGTVWAPNIPGWTNYPLRCEVISSLGKIKIPVKIESDRACCILGEMWRGAARGCRNAVFLAVGTGIGAGILADGRILRGADDIAGAIGWLALARPHRAAYVQCGCFESHASGAGIAKMARQFPKELPKYNGVLKKNPPAELTAHNVFSAYTKKDSIAIRVLKDAVAFWGMAAANLVSLFNPEKIIFGGGVFGPGLRFLPQIRAEAKKWAQPVGFHRVKFAGSRLGTHAALHGAAYLALSGLRN